MKKIIAPLVICSILTAFTTTKTFGQTNPHIADETELSETKTMIKVTTSNEGIYMELMKKYRGKVNHIVMYPNKKDRKGTYAEYIVYFKLEMKPEIETFLKQL